MANRFTKGRPKSTSSASYCSVMTVYGEICFNQTTPICVYSAVSGKAFRQLMSNDCGYRWRWNRANITTVEFLRHRHDNMQRMLI